MIQLGVDVLIRAWGDCTPGERERGVAWYPRAHDIAVDLARQFHYSISSAAAIIAALSPGLDWKRNVLSATRVMQRAGTVSGYGPNQHKAQLLMVGGGPEFILGGLKVVAFYRLIRDGGNDLDVCVDGHAANMVLQRGKRLIRDSDTSPAEQLDVADSFRLAAHIIGIRPCDLQAATWLAWRSSNGFRQGRIIFPATAASL